MAEGSGSRNKGVYLFSCSPGAIQRPLEVEAARRLPVGGAIGVQGKRLGEQSLGARHPPRWQWWVHVRPVQGAVADDRVEDRRRALGVESIRQRLVQAVDAKGVALLVVSEIV
eukprot:7562451-Pyramimonas_sp.AAC.1